jgi:hypothetical protein
MSAHFGACNSEAKLISNKIICWNEFNFTDFNEENFPTFILYIKQVNIWHWTNR